MVLASPEHYLYRVYGNLSLREDEPQVFDFQLHEEAFLWLKIKVVSAKKNFKGIPIIM